VLYEDPLGWTAEIPEGWHVLPLDGSNGRYSVRGAAISNEPLRAGPDGTYPDLSGLFPDGAALIVTHREGGPAPDYLSDDSTFPLRWGDFQAIPGGLVVGSTLDFRANGMDFTLDLAVRADAPEDLVRTLQAIVASIHPLPLTDGELPNGYFVVSAGAVAEAPAIRVLDLISDTGKEERFLLVHAPGGYYALDLPSGAGPSSEFIWDAPTQEIVWTQGGEVFARYDREGAPALQPPGADLAPLLIHPVVRAWDAAHLLLRPDVTFGPLPPEMWGSGS
jgi:hypothetical protein